MATDELKVIDIIAGTTVDGPGLRTSIYFAGCDHACPGCHNPQSWDRNAGSPRSIDELMAQIEEEGFNVTFSGGDPLQQPADALVALAQAIHALGKTVWCYTGYRYEDICHHPELARVLVEIDVLVDGPFVERLRDTSLRFRGSSNQRLIDLHRSTPDNIVLYTD